MDYEVMSMGQLYEVTAMWTEQYYASLRIEADDEKAARERAKAVWRLRPDWFVDSGKFDASRLLGFRVDACDATETPHVPADEPLE